MASAEKARFFQRVADEGLALTYDDVRMQTRAGAEGPLPEQLDTSSYFSRHVELKVPFVSAAMDTVTGSEMAIAMAKLGGIGVVHAGQDIEDQYRAVQHVKKAVNGVIEKPITAHESDSLANVLRRCDEKGYDFRTFPVLNSDGKFVGLLTGNDFKFPDSMEVTVASAMTPAKKIAHAAADTSRQDAYRKMMRRKVSTLPLLEDDGSVAGMYIFSDVSRIERDGGGYNVDDEKRLRVAAAISTGPTGLERAERLSKYVDVLVVDTADGDSYYAFQTLRELKTAYPKIDVVVGNISDGPSARLLAEAGADGIKVGQGPGSICTTRRETGIGMPQVTAVYESVAALGDKYVDVPVCADGGIKEHGDIPIAFAAGAHNVMMGRVLAGTTEAPGVVKIRADGSRVKMYRGMGSLSALRENETSRQRYQVQGGGQMLAQGVEAEVPFAGSVDEVLGLCLSALQSSMRYVKAPDITTLREDVLLRRITGAGLRESHPHDIQNVKE